MRFVNHAAAVRAKLCGSRTDELPRRPRAKLIDRMTSILKPILLVATYAIAFTAYAQLPTGAQLAAEKQCIQCHSVDKDTIGPSFEKIKAIYRSMKNPEGSLIDVMRLGSAAHLGPMSGKARMPDDSERPLIDDAEARQLARWILELP